MPFQIVRNDIVKMHVDAIVNTANPAPGYGSGIDSAVYEAAGAGKLLAKRREIGVIERGTSVITEGFDLPAKYIIHTVGTPWQGGTHGEENIIRDCYKSVFRIAVEENVQSLAIPLLASGCYGFPKGIALRIALSEIEAFLAEHEAEVYLVVFDEKAVALSTELYGDIDKYISDNYVELKAAEEYAPSCGRERRRRGFAMWSAAKEAKSAHSQPMVDAESMVDAEPMVDAQSMIDARVMLSAQPKANNRSLDDVISNIDKTFMELVFSFADAKGISDAELHKKSNIDRKAFSKLKCGITRNPSKSTALALAIGLELNLDETKDLLSRAGYALSPCSRQDIIVQYFIEKKVYDINAINIALFDHGEGYLGMGLA